MLEITKPTLPANSPRIIQSVFEIMQSKKPILFFPLIKKMPLRPNDNAIQSIPKYFIGQ
jgi:hypothetical protein